MHMHRLSSRGRIVLVVIFILVMMVATGVMSVSDAIYRFEACKAADFPAYFCWLPEAINLSPPMSVVIDATRSP